MKKDCSLYFYNLAIIFFTAAFILPAAADGLYKWVDERGRVTYQSSPPPEDAASVEQSAISATVNEAPADEAVAGETETTDATEETEEAEAVPITFFSTADCIPCEDFRAYLEENELVFEEIDISEDTDMAEEMKDKHGHNTVPTIVVGNKSITGEDVKALSTLLKNSGFEVLPIDEEANTR